MPDCTLNYSIVSKIENGTTIYGIEVTKTCCGHIERSCVSDITSKRDEIMLLFEKVRLGNVTPVALFDIAEDFITEKALTLF